MKWLVEDLLRPDALEPDPEAMVRGSYAHEVLERTYRRLARGDRRAARDAREPRPRRSASCSRSCASARSEFRLSPKQTRVRAAARRLEFDLLRYLRSEADADPASNRRSSSSSSGSARAASRWRSRAGCALRGRIDRVDVKDDMALVIDYKTGRSVDRYKVASWEPENRFQAALYMLVVERLLGRRAVGGVYVALASEDPRPRGMVAADVEELGSGYFDNDRLSAEEFQEKLDWALGRIRETDARMRSGAICSRAGQLRLERRLQVPLDLPGASR